jgi:hypothetical protein
VLCNNNIEERLANGKTGANTATSGRPFDKRKASGIMRRE